MKKIEEKIHIRLAADDDFETILSIWLNGINAMVDERSNQESFKAKFSANFFQRNGIFNFWVAVDEDDIIYGWQSLIKIFYHPFRQDTYAESSTYIAKNHRFNGIGKKLLEFVLKEAEESSLEYVIGFVSLANEAARKITKETGWIEIGQLPDLRTKQRNILKSILIRPV